VASDAADELVASRMYSTTSHVCSVASGAKETRRRAIVRVSVNLIACRRCQHTQRLATGFAPLLLVLVIRGQNRLDCGDEGGLSS
jgi:hypothetical protein